MAQGPRGLNWVTIRITSGSRRPKSEIRIYQRVLMKFYEELGYGLETN